MCFIPCPRGHGPHLPKGKHMYTVALFIVMAILLEAVMKVLHSVLGTVGLGDTVSDAQRAAYALAAKVRFEGMQYRRDIGHRAIAREAGR